MLSAYLTYGLTGLFVSVSYAQNDGDFWPNTCCTGKLKSWATHSVNGVYVGPSIVSKAQNINFENVGRRDTLELGYLKDPDCPSGGDPITYYGAHSNIPNNGYEYESQCEGGTSEVDIKLDNDHIDFNYDHYYFYVVWRCRQTGWHRTAIETSRNGVTQIQRSAARNCSSTVRSGGEKEPQENLSQPFNDDESVLIHSNTIQDYSYFVYQYEDQYKVEVNVDFDSDNSLTSANEGFVSTMYESSTRSSIDDLAQERAAVSIIFTNPLTHQQASDFVSSRGLEVTQYGIFGKSKNRNDTVSSYYLSQDGDIDPFSETMSLDDETTILYDGVMIVSGLIDFANIEAIGSQYDVSLVDVSANLIQDEIYSELNIDIPVEKINIPHQAWNVYENQLPEPTSINMSQSDTILSQTPVVLAILFTGCLITVMVSLKVRAYKNE